MTTAQELNTPITRIKSVSGETYYELGGLFENIYLGVDEKNDNKLKNYTLYDLYTELKNYFDYGNFIYYSNIKPDSPQIKIWFDTSVKEEETE